jgi:hypothetical protein
MLEWAQRDFHNKCIGTHYVKLVGSVGLIVRPNTSEARNIEAHFFMRWTHYVELVFLHPMGSPGHVVLFGAFGL